MRAVVHMFAWFLLFTLIGWLIGANVYWRFTNPHLTETQLWLVYWKDQVFFFGAIIFSWLIVTLTEPK